MTLLPQLERDLIDAAGRARSARRLARRAMPLVVAGVAAALAIVALRVWRAEEPASPGGPNRTAHPNRGPRPVAGTFSTPVAFSFDGVRYSMVGFRSRGGLVCIQLSRPGGGPRFHPESVTCAGGRLLRRQLEAAQVLNVGRAGGGPRYYRIGGFATAETSRVAVTGTRHRSRVVLSDPWRPGLWHGKPVRAFTAVVLLPSGDRRQRLRELMKIRVRAVELAVPSRDR